MPQLGILSPTRKAVADQAASEGAALNPHDLSQVEQLVLAVKPAKWRAVASGLIERLSPDCIVVSVMAGVTTASLAEVFGARASARVMPTTAVSAACGVAAVFSDDPAGRAAAHHLFDPIAETPDLSEESMIDVATAMSGSGAAYAYAFVRALQKAGVRAGLDEVQAAVLARATVAGAIQKVGEDADLDQLVGEVASPGGTTEAGLNVLEPALSDLIHDTVQAALARARALSA